MKFLAKCGLLLCSCSRWLSSPRRFRSSGLPSVPTQINGKTNNLENGKIQALAVFAGNPNVMYAGGGLGSGSEGPPSQAGAFKTTDGTPLVSGSAPVPTLASAGGVTLAGTDSEVVLWQARGSK